MNNKKHSQLRKCPFQQIGLIFYCYLLIPLNELALKSLRINNLKNRKKFIVIINRSIQNAGKGVFSENVGTGSQQSSDPNAVVAHFSHE